MSVKIAIAASLVLPNQKEKIEKAIKQVFSENMDLFFISDDIEAVQKTAITTTACRCILENVQPNGIDVAAIAADIKLKNGSAKVIELGRHLSKNEIFDAALIKDTVNEYSDLIGYISKEIIPKTVLS